jgi:hypothetical protein
MKQDPTPEKLRFFTERRLVELTGLRARNIKDLYNVLRSVSGSSIFYHTHEIFLQHHFAAPSFRNDFSIWVTEALQEIHLGEELAGIDIRDFMSVRSLRMRILAILKTHLQQYPDLRQAAPEDAFHFCKAKSFLMPTHLEATDFASFVDAMHLVTKSSLFYHFFAARFRLARRTNDFSYWLELIGETEVARAIDRLDPYFLDLEEVRKRTVSIAEAALRARSGS